MHYRLGSLAAVTFSVAAFGQNLIVTAEGHNGTTPPKLIKDDVSVEVNRHPARVENWVPLRGEQADLELYLVIDDGTNSDLGIQFESLKSFINGQPGTTRIGLAYLRNGSANIVTPLTADHAQIAKALRLPVAQPGISASPYMGISDLVKKWPTAEARRENIADYQWYRSVVAAGPTESVFAKSDSRCPTRRNSGAFHLLCGGGPFGTQLPAG